MVFRHLSDLEQDPEITFDWNSALLDGGLNSAPATSRKDHTERRLINAARRFAEEQKSSPSELADAWEQKHQVQQKRAQDVREAMRSLAGSLPALLPPSSERDRLEKVLAHGHAEFAGFCLSLKRDSVDLITRDNPGQAAVEIWYDRRFLGERRRLISEVRFSRSQLIEQFERGPSQARDMWIEKFRKTKWWPIGLAATYVSWDGDLFQVYRQVQNAEKFGFQPVGCGFEKAKKGQDGEADFFGSAQPAPLLMSGLRTGNLKARGVQKESGSFGGIPSYLWHYLDFKSEYLPGGIIAFDPTKRTKLEWTHISVNAKQLKDLIRPRGVSRLIGPDEVGMRTAYVDTQEKKQLWELVDFLGSNVEKSGHKGYAKEAVLAELFPESDPSERQRYWLAALMVIPKGISEQWTRPGPKKINKTVR
jgi:hypothetical protein